MEHSSHTPKPDRFQIVTTGETGVYTHLLLTLRNMFATEPDTRIGLLVKHLATEYYNTFIFGTKTILQTLTIHPLAGMDENQHRTLVIEGAALSHFLDNPAYEEYLFSVARCCKSLIACRVNPKQKALLVKMAKNFATLLLVESARRSRAFEINSRTGRDPVVTENQNFCI